MTPMAEAPVELPIEVLVHFADLLKVFSKLQNLRQASPSSEPADTNQLSFGSGSNVEH